MSVATGSACPPTQQAAPENLPVNATIPSASTPSSPPDKGGLGGVAGLPPVALTQKTTAPATDTLSLIFDDRKRSRLRVTLASGREAGIFLERGEHLQDGDRLASEDGGTVVQILAAPEKLVQVAADSALLFARAAYHLGNRHVPVQIVAQENGGYLLFQTDHVLAEMARGLGCRISEVIAPFQPESGAYGGGHQHHNHGYEARDLHNPGHGPHRSVPKIHEFKPV